MNIDEELKASQLIKINAEIAKIKAEKSKIVLEEEEIDKRVNTPFLKSRNFVQVIWTAIITVPIIWFYFQNIVQPILKKNEYDLENSKNELLKLNEKYKSDTTRLDSNRKELTKRNRYMDSTYIVLLQHFSQIQGDLKNCLSSNQRKDLQEHIKQLRNFFDFGQLNSYKIGIYYYASNTNQAQAIEKYLREKGFKGICKLYSKDKQFMESVYYNPDAFEIRYEVDYETDEALKLKDILDQYNTNIKFNLRKVKNRTDGFLSIFIPENQQ